MMIWEDGIMGYINLALADIYSYEGKKWSFQYVSDEQLVTSGTTNAITLTLDNPILALQAIRENRDGAQALQIDLLRTKNINTTYQLSSSPMAAVEVFYIPGTNVITLSNNTTWYVIDYFKAYKKISSMEEEIPVGDIFLGALYSFTMSYIFPVYWQYGEWKEANLYAQWRQRLADLMKTDNLPINIVKSNVR